MTEKKGNSYDESSNQAWPSFVDILSSTVLVLCFALLILILILTLTRITSSTKNLDDESSPSSFRVETDVLGEYRAEFQKLSIVANPSLKKEEQVISDVPVSDSESESPIYVPVDMEDPIEDVQQQVKEPGDSLKQVLGDIPKSIETKSLEVLKELIIVQRDVIEQQRKVIEQQDEEILETTREYQSLLSLVTQEKEVEDIRQLINQKPDQAKFISTDQSGAKLSGNTQDPKGEGTYFLSPPNTNNSNVDISSNSDGVRINFFDNAPFFNEKSYTDTVNVIRDSISDYRTMGVVLETKITDFAVSGAEAQRIAVERLLLVRTMLIDAGLPPSLIKLKTLSKEDIRQDLINKGLPDEVAEEENYGWIDIKSLR